MKDIPIRKTYYDLMEKYQYIGKIRYKDKSGSSREDNISFDSDNLLSESEVMSQFSSIVSKVRKQYEIEELKEIELEEIDERLEEEDYYDLEDQEDYFFRFNFFGASRREVLEAYVEAVEREEKEEFIAPFSELTEAELEEIDIYSEELDKLKVSGLEKYQALSDLAKTILKER